MRPRVLWAMFAGLAALVAFVWYDTTCAAPPASQWGPFTGRVVDAQTNDPIPGAIFVAQWERWIPNPVHSKWWFNDARAAVADKDGKFEIPGRWPPLLSSLIGLVRLTCVAPGYAPYVSVGPEHAQMTVRLTPLPPSQREDRGSSWSSELGSIPDDRLKKLEASVNAKRRQLGLRPVGLFSGVL